LIQYVVRYKQIEQSMTTISTENCSNFIKTILTNNIYQNKISKRYLCMSKKLRIDANRSLISVTYNTLTLSALSYIHERTFTVDRP